MTKRYLPFILSDKSESEKYLRGGVGGGRGSRINRNFEWPQRE